MRHRHPPVLHTEVDDDEPRKVAWLELFYDLVYVAAIIQIGDLLSEDVSLSGFTHFAVLFFVLWWSWTGTTAYFNRFVVDDNVHRALVVLQMVAVANLAINAPEAFDGGDTLGVAWWFVVVRVLLLALYARSYRHCPSARPMLRTSLVWGAAGTAVFVVAPFVEQGPRAVVWLVGVAVTMWGTFAPGASRLERDVPGDDDHLAERFALFTIIVLGESFVKTITGLAEEGVSVGDEILGGLGFVVIVAFWWTYFDHIADHGVPEGFWGMQAWVYLHLPLMMSITAVGVGTKKIALSEVGEPTSMSYALLYGGSAAVAVLSMAALMWIQGSRRAALSRFASAGALAVVVVIAGDDLGVGVFAVLVAAIAAAPHLLDEVGELDGDDVAGTDEAPRGDDAALDDPR